MRTKAKDILCKTSAIATCILAYAISFRLEKRGHSSSRIYVTPKDWYGLAAKAISRSNMLSGDKTAALRMLLSNGPNGYYQSVVFIANSNMLSGDKLTALKEESLKFIDTTSL